MVLSMRHALQLPDAVVESVTPVQRDEVIRVDTMERRLQRVLSYRRTENLYTALYYKHSPARCTTA
jgi:hypothetical protein